MTLKDSVEDYNRLVREYKKLWNAIKEHHDQEADDRCIEDDDKLYAVAGLPLCDRRVGNKEEMLENCKKFIENRCEDGGWESYRSIRLERDALKKERDDLIEKVKDLTDDLNKYMEEFRCGY